VFDADRRGVDVPVPGVPADVLGLEMLGHGPVGGPDRVVPAEVGLVLRELDRLVVGGLGVVDDDVLDLRGPWPVRDVMVAVRGRILRIQLDVRLAAQPALRAPTPAKRRSTGVDCPATLDCT
jgi:hypothetical protein